MLGSVHGAFSTTTTAGGGRVGAQRGEIELTEVLTVIVDPEPSAAPVETGRLKRVVWLLGTHAWLLTAVLSVIVAVAGFRGGDYPAQDYRAFMFGAHGFLIWDVNWYGGHALLGYSVLFPAVGWFLGTVPATALACITSTVLFGRIVGPANSWPVVASRLWFAVFVVGDLIVGRAPFACSVTAALATVLAVRARRPWAATAAAIIASLFSPLGAAFLLLVAAAWLPNLGWRRAAPFAGAFAGLAVTLVAGDGGVFPFPWTAFVGQMAIVTIGLVVAPGHERELRRMLWLYGACCVLFFLVPNPIGGNMARFAGIMIGPVAALVLWQARRVRALLVLAVPLLVFQLLPIASAVASATGDPSTKPRYYLGMLDFLDGHQHPLGRVEIPFTRDHWEARYVAEQVPLARGWDRQVDLSRNAVLYQPLTATAYEQWLHENAVRYVALPTAPLDQGGQAEKALLKHPPAWLKPVFSDSQWRIWQVVGATPLASGVAPMTALTASSFTLLSSGPGITFVRLRYSPYWHVDTSAAACVAQAAGGWTTVLAFGSGAIKVSVRAQLGKSGCTDQQLATFGLTDAGAPEPVS